MFSIKFQCENGAYYMYEAHSYCVQLTKRTDYSNGSRTINELSEPNILISVFPTPGNDDKPFDLLVCKGQKAYVMNGDGQTVDIIKGKGKS